MKIFRTSDKKDVPVWIFEKDYLKDIELKFSKSVSSLNHLSSVNVTTKEDFLSGECDYIEHCVERDMPYYYSESWDKNDVNHLREYASAVGMKKDMFLSVQADKNYDFTAAEMMESRAKEILKEIEDGDLLNSDPQKVEDIIKGEIPPVRDEVLRQIQSKGKIAMSSDNGNKMVKEAQSISGFGDPFKLDDIEDRKLDDKWEQVKDSVKLSDRPSILSGAVRPVRGGEDYYANSESKIAPGRNSLDNPQAIENMIKSESEDNGVRLRREREERNQKIASEKVEREQKIIDSMKSKDIIPKGKVFPTEVMNAQPGLNSPSSRQGVYAKFNADDVPEKTDGEMISEKNESHRKSIQREAKQDDWQHPSHQNARSISDSFAESLSNTLKKLK